MTDSYQDFVFPALQTDIVFGFGTLQKLPERLAGLGVSRPLLVTDQGIVKAGILSAVRDVLLQGGFTVAVYDKVPQDSSVAVVEEALESLRDAHGDGVVGIGGGSSMDSAKCVAIRATSREPLQDLAGLGKVTSTPLPMIAVPTTAGTGSEVSYWAVTKDDATGAKFSVGGALVFPRVALCDPLLTLGLPPSLTATTGMDALTHAIESFTNRSHQPISEALSLRAIELIAGSLGAATRKGSNREARYDMMLGSMLAGVAMNPTRLGVVHALAMPFGSRPLSIPHGAANAVMLPHVMEFNLSFAPEKYARVAKALGADPGEGDAASLTAIAWRGLEKLLALQSSLGIASRMRDLGLTSAHIPAVCAEAMKSGNIAANPRPVTEGDLREICYRAL